MDFAKVKINGVGKFNAKNFDDFEKLYKEIKIKYKGDK